MLMSSVPFLIFSMHLLQCLTFLFISFTAYIL